MVHFRQKAVDDTSTPGYSSFRVSGLIFQSRETRLQDERPSARYRARFASSFGQSYQPKCNDRRLSADRCVSQCPGDDTQAARGR